MGPECCKSIYLSGGGVDTSKVLEERVGKYSNHSFGPSGHLLYVRIGVSGNSSIVYGDEKGWRLYNGIETNPDYAGSGLIKFGCSSKCLVACDSSKYKFWNKDNEKFEIDSSLAIECISTGTPISPLAVRVVVLILSIVLFLLVLSYMAWRWKKQRKRASSSTVQPVDTSSNISIQGHSQDNTYQLDDNIPHHLEG